jgi:hypothetical protein
VVRRQRGVGREQTAIQRKPQLPVQNRRPLL